MALPKPVSRADMYLSYLNYTKGLTLANLPKPVSRADMYLYNLCINRGIGGGSGGSNVTLNGEPQTNFNFIGDENSTISALQIGEKTYSFNGGSSGDTTDNVVDRAGRTQEQINRTFYKRMCKEIPSPNGEPITVNNGEEGYVLSAEIKGQTVKNEILNYGRTDNLYWSNATAICISYSDTYYSLINSTYLALRGAREGVVSPDIDLSKNYTFLLDIKENPLESFTLITHSSEQVTIEKGFTGIKKFTGKLKTNYQALISASNTITASESPFVFRFMFVEGDGSNVDSFFSGLSSTQAVISNNGEKYTFYHPTELNEDGSKKVISLRGTSETKDTLEIKEDGIGVWTRNLVTQAIKYSDNWQTYDKYADGYKTYKVKQKEQIMNVNSICICDKLPHQKWITAIYPTPALAGEYITVHGDAFVISVKEETAPTLDDFKNYLKQIGDIIITYPTKTPTTTPIPKELVPTILTQQTNILEVGGKVKASSFKVTLPVDAIGELRAEINEIKKQLGAVAALQLGQIN